MKKISDAAIPLTGEENSPEIIKAIDENINTAWKLVKERPLEAAALARQAVEQAHSIKNAYQKARTMLCLGDCLLQENQYDEALRYAQEACNIFEKLDTGREKAQALNILGNIYTRSGNDREALIKHEAALAIQKETDDREGQANSCNSLGIIYSHAGEYGRALEYYHESLAIRQETGDRYNEAMTLNNISYIYRKISDHEKALEYHCKTLEVRCEINDVAGQAASYNNIGNVYWSMQDISKAGENYQKALSLYEALGDVRGQAISTMNVANVYSNSGDLAYALQLQMKSLQMLREIGDAVTEMVALMNIGELYFEEGTYFRDIDKAIEYLQEACTFFQERGLKVNLSKGYRILADFFEKLGQFDKAYECFKKYHVFEQEIFNEKSGQKLKNVQARMELEQARKEVEQQQHMNEELAQLNKQLQQAYEETLQTSQANIAAVIENTDDLIWSFDRDYKLITFNSNFCHYVFELYGETTIPGMYFFDIGSSQENEYWKNIYDRALSGEKFCLEFVYTLQGEKRYSEISFNPIYSEGQITGAVAFAKDITERRHSEKALKNAKINIEALIENTSDGIWSVNRDFHLVTFNTALANYCFRGYGKLVATGMHLSEILSEEAYTFLLPYYEAALRGERKVFDFQTNEGAETTYMEVSLGPISIQGNITGVVGFARNITERKRYEEALKLSQANMAAVMENISDLLWSVDEEYKLVTFNSNFRDFMSRLYGVDIAPGMYPFNMGSDKDSEYWTNVYRRAIDGEKFSFDLGYTLQGNKRYADISLNPVVTDGIVTGAVAISRDITERKQNEFALKTSQANISALIENSTASFWSIDRNYCLLTFNSVFANTMFEANNIQVHIGDCVRDVFPSEQTEPWIPLYDRCFAGENVAFDFEVRNGEVRHFEISLNPIITDGEITGAACSSRDITLRKITEDRMLEHNALLDIANEAIIVRDLDTTVTFWNKTAEKMYGWTEDEVIGRSITELVYNEETIQTFRQAWKELLFSGQWSGELIQHNRNGKEIITYCRWTLVFDAEGKPKSVLSINSDITEQKSLQHQFYRSQRLESLGTLASGIAHDLNNILTPILLSVEILRMKYPEDKNSRMLETIETSAKRGAEIVKQVLIFASGVSGERKPISLADSIREIEMIVRKTFAKSIELQVRIAGEARPVLGDSTQIQQILMNLCVNARDAMPEGGQILIELESRIPTSELFATTPEARSMEYTVLKVSDTGSGIPRHILEKIFDPFFTTKEIGSGTGLGLSTVNAIVKSHDGFIKVESKEGKGTSFEIWIPSFNEKDSELVIPEETEIALSGQGKTILIVDDEPIILQLICYSLEKFGFTIFTADNGNAALFVFKEHPEIELVITDINMPGMDGPALVGELLLLQPTLKFIIMTGLSINNRMDEMKTVGVSSFLSKPFKTNMLLKAIENAVNPEIINIV